MVVQFTASQRVGQRIAAEICHLIGWPFDFSSISNYLEAGDAIAQALELGEIEGPHRIHRLLGSNCEELTIWLEKDNRGQWIPTRALAKKPEYVWLEGKVDSRGNPLTETVIRHTEFSCYGFGKDGVWGWQYGASTQMRVPNFETCWG